MTTHPNFIILCEQAFLTAGTNNLNLIGIFTNINAEQFPFTYRHFSLVVNFETDVREAHELETIVRDDSGAQIVNSKISVTINGSPFQVIANFENLAFPRPGRYEISVSLDGKTIGSRALMVNPVISRTKNIA